MPGEAKFTYPLIGAEVLNQDTDPLLLSFGNPRSFVDCRNIDIGSGTRALRSGFENGFKEDGGSDDTIKFMSAGVFFPFGAKAILPHTDTDFSQQFYVASSGSGNSNHFTSFLYDFWLKSNTTYPFDRYIFRIKHPINSSTYGGDIENYVSLKFTVNSESKAKNYLYFSVMNSSDPGSAVPDNVDVYTLDTETSGYAFPCDNEWHRVSIAKAKDGTDWKLLLYVDSVLCAETTLSDGYAFPHSDVLYAGACSYTTSEEPLCYNALWLGEGGNLSISEFRLAAWDNDNIQTKSDILSWLSTYSSDELNTSSLPSEIKCYIPFNEGQGKTFTEYVNSIEGYLSPQEPWVNDDYELQFSGNDCVALPSRSTASKYDPDSRDSMDGEADLNVAFARNPYHMFSAQGTGWDTWMDGTYQVRLKLMGLKEGCLIGNLWLRKASGGSSSGYHIVIQGHCCSYNYPSSGAISHDVYTTSAIVDDSWIGVEKTITVTVTTSGSAVLSSHTFTLSVDDDTYTVGSGLTEFPSDANVHRTYQAYFYYHASYGSRVEMPSYKYDPVTSHSQYDKPMIGGHEASEKYCVPYKLVFFRSWHKREFSTTEVDSSYNDEDLDVSYKYGLKNFPAWMISASVGGTYANRIISILEGGVNPFPDGDTSDGWYDESDAGILNVVNTFETEKQDMPNESFSYELDSHDDEIRFDIMQRTIRSLYEDVNAADIELFGAADDYDIYELSSGYVDKLNFAVFNSVTFSQNVSWYNSDTFKENKEQRVYFDYVADANWLDPSNDFGLLKGIFGFYDVIVSDTVLQGERKFGDVKQKTRFILLGTQKGFADIENVDHVANSSIRCKWVSGGAYLRQPSPVRGIYRYISEDKKIDKTIIVVHNTIYSYDLSTKQLSVEDVPFERDDDEMCNFETANNKLIVMTSKNAVKLNNKGNWSQLGIDRPSKIVIDVFGKSSGGIFDDANTDYHYAYVCQFYDSENDVYSGTIPIYSDASQGVRFSTDSTGAFTDSPATIFANQLFVNVNSNLDGNVDRLYIYRTINLETSGASTADLYLVASVGVSKVFMDTETSIDPSTGVEWYNTYYPLSNATTLTRKKGNVYQDIWDDSVLVNNSVLPLRWQGGNLKPPRCKAMATVFNRLCLGNSDDYKNGLYYSEVDDLGFPRPDMVTSSNLLLISQGNPREITAIFGDVDVGYLFQSNAMYLLAQPTSGTISARIVSGNIGCVNQKCVTKIGNAIYFLSSNGIYRYTSGTPELISEGLNKFFRETVNRDYIENSFMVYETSTNRLRVYIPVASSYCDCCIVYDFNVRKFYIEDVPDVTCGHEIYDNGEYTLFLGGRYGNLFKVTNGTQHYDITYERNVSPTISGTTISKTGASWNTNRYGCCGYPVFLVNLTGDPEYMQVWKGIVSEPNSSATSLTVESWRQLFNASADPTEADYSFLGGLYYEFKTGLLNFPKLYFEKKVTKLEFYTNKMDHPGSTDCVFGVNVGIDHDKTLNKYTLTVGDGNDYGYKVLMRDRGKLHQVEIAGVFVGETDIKTIVFEIIKSSSKYG